MIARFALLVAPSDPLLSTAPARLEALGWLRNQVTSRGFKVAIVGGAGNAVADLEKVAASISPGDLVLVHVSGRLATNDSIALTPTTSLSLAALGEHLAPRSPGYVSMILDLVQGDDAAGDPIDLLTEAAQSIGAEERGYTVLAALRPADGSDRIAFTRLAMPPLGDDGPPSSAALLSSMHDRAAGQNGASGHTFTLLRGAPDETIDGLVAQAMQTSDWGRAVELRLDRVETLATPAQRAMELTAIARIVLGDLGDADAAIDILEKARSLDPKKPAVLEALRHAYEAAGRAPPIDPADYVKAFTTHRKAGQVDAALLDAMLLDEMGAAEPEHLAMVEQSRSVGPMQALKPLDAAAWEALRAPGFDEAVAWLLAAVHDTAVAVRLEQSSRRRLDAASRLDAESTVSAVRTLHWAARVLGVTCPDLYPSTDDAGDAITHAPNERPSVWLAPRVLSGMSAKQLAFLAGRAMTWYRPEYHCMLYYPTLDDLRELIAATLQATGFEGMATTSSSPSNGELQRVLLRRLGAEERAAISDAAARIRARDGDIALEHWIRSADLTAARAGLLLCGELKTAVTAVRSQSPAPGRPSSERVAADLVAFCASRSHAALRAEFLRAPSPSIAPPPR